MNPQEQEQDESPGHPPAQSPMCDEFIRPHHCSQSHCPPFPAPGAAGHGSSSSLSRAAPSSALVPSRISPPPLTWRLAAPSGDRGFAPRLRRSPGWPSPAPAPEPSALHLCLGNTDSPFYDRG